MRGTGVVLGVLDSPLHGLLDRHVCGLRFIGRRTGNIVRLPVQYAPSEQGILVVPGRSAGKRWWRNFSQPRTVEVLLRGSWRVGTGRLARPGETEWAAGMRRYRSVYHRLPADSPDPVVLIDLDGGPLPQPPEESSQQSPSQQSAESARRRLWRRWVAWVSAGEAAGFALPAVVGALTVHSRTAVALPALLAAGAVEGALLGAAQAHVLRGVIPALPRARWVAVTSLAAVLAYLVALLPSSFGDAWQSWPWPVIAVLAAVLGLVLLASIGTAQWTVLRHHLRRAWRWIGWTAAGWLAALGAFMLIATPLWQEGQPLWLTIAIGVFAGVIMAGVAAAVTGLGLIRMIGSSRS